MSKLSQMRIDAKTNHQAVLKKFEAVRSLDNNPLFDQDPENGSVHLQIDDYRSPEDVAQGRTFDKPTVLTASAKFDENGTPQAMEWKTVRVNDRTPNGEMDTPVNLCFVANNVS